MNESDNRKSECPVCHMMIDGGSYAVNFQGRPYAFCSVQCRQRFDANPHLYIGRPGKPSPAQQGHEIIRKRKLKLRDAYTDEQRFVIESELNALMGIIEVSFEKTYLVITYDLLQVTTEQIEAAIEKTGNQLSADMGTRLKQAFIHYVEETELDNLEQPGNGHGHS